MPSRWRCWPIGRRRCATCIADDAIRAVVLTGAGRIFCSGGDVKRMARVAAGGQTAWDRGQYLVNHVHRIPLTLQELDKPYIVAVNGAATGAGMDMALMGDLRFAAESARFAESYIKVGFVAGDGGAWMLPRLIGTPKALEMLWTGDFVSAAEAERIGLINKVLPDDQLMSHSMAVAERLASGPTVAIRLMKRMVRQGADQFLRRGADLCRELHRRCRRHRGLQGGDGGLRREAQARVQGALR